MPVPVELRGHYLSLLKSIHRERVPRTYVEIGVYRGRAFTRASRRTIAVGIDPAPMLRDKVSKRARIYKATSDDFFAQNDLAAILGGPFDVAFIDGLHHFEVALRDFRNLEQYAGPSSLILLHDCCPPSVEWTSREPRKGSWAGDVWRLLPCLAAYRPDLQVSVAAARPTGLGIVGGLNPSNRVLFDRYDEIVEATMSLTFADYAPPNVVPPDWEDVARVVPGPYRRRGLFEGAGYRIRRLLRGSPAWLPVRRTAAWWHRKRRGQR